MVLWFLTSVAKFVLSDRFSCRLCYTICTVNKKYVFVVDILGAAL